MKQITSLDISQKMKFSRVGYDYENIIFDPVHHCGIWRMTKVIDGVVEDMGYEVVKGMRRKNPDGSIVYVYPGDEQFGSYGFFDYHLDRVKKILERWTNED